jgi:hypothetical protein
MVERGSEEPAGLREGADVGAADCKEAGAYSWGRESEGICIGCEVSVRREKGPRSVRLRTGRGHRVKRSRGPGMKATYVRQLIREEPFVTGADVLADAAKRMGDSRLRISRK